MFVLRDVKEGRPLVGFARTLFVRVPSAELRTGSSTPLRFAQDDGGVEATAWELGVMWSL
jgi:hypothetical protein